MTQLTTWITATFPSGVKLSRDTKKNYTHAWRVCWLRPLNADGKPVDSRGHVCMPRNGSESGFASSYDLASKAAATVANRINGYPGYQVTTQEVAEIDR